MNLYKVELRIFVMNYMLIKVYRYIYEILYTDRVQCVPLCFELCYCMLDPDCCVFGVCLQDPHSEDDQVQVKAKPTSTKVPADPLLLNLLLSILYCTSPLFVNRIIYM